MESTEALRQIRLILDQVDAGPSTPGIPAMSGPLGASGKWSRVFNDDFTDPTLNPSWRKGRQADAAGGHSGYNSTERGFYLADQVSVKDGKLVLTATNEPVKVVKNQARQGTLDGNTYYSPQEMGTWPYRTGTVTTGRDLNGWIGQDWKAKPETFAFRYGWLEGVIKVPKGKGLWPAFWLLRPDSVWPPEIDILEVVDPECRKVAQHLHYGAKGQDHDWQSNSVKDTRLGYDTGLDLSQDFHTFGLDWQSDAIRYYLDGKLTAECTDPNVLKWFDAPMYMILNLAVGGSWPGNPDVTTPFPAEMLVDRVSVWQKA